MNICHIITRLIIGGAQENTILTCAGLHDRGHQVTLLVGPETGPEGSLHDEAHRGGYDVRIVPNMCRAVRPLTDLRARRELAAMLRDLRPEVVHTHSSKAGILGRLAARDAGVPIIVHTIHGMSFNRTQSWPVQMLYRWLERYCARFTQALVTVADAMRDQAVAVGIAPRDKFVTVYSGMRTELFDPARGDRAAVRRRWGAADEEIVIGAVARLFRNKGYEVLIPAMALAAQRNSRLRFVWVGDGAQRTDYEKQLESMGIRGRVHLTGLLAPQRVPEMLAGMDLLVHASQWEGLPRAAVQALLMECPVISFDIDGAPEVVLPGRTGALVRLNDVPGLAEAMVTLAGDASERRRLGRAGRQLCLERFDQRKMVSELESLYLRLQQDAGPNRTHL
ncbi:MAG TPA: glycosyltransferase family 4 protein [Phycisphaerae bacterium]|nr:glycosyltransferase family 4 protein [Phycisphaerae bacterium]HRY68052.1 glycosyltransferase family 4 protein [Phycisphaerae bacterium]HSA28668.1 glycosyltransferase family 4 protein [Phycisphaerae bacterium]